MKDLKISQLPKIDSINSDALISIVLDGKNVTVTPEELDFYLNSLPVCDITLDPDDLDKSIELNITKRTYYRVGEIKSLKVYIKNNITSYVRFIAMPNTRIFVNDVEYKEDVINKAFVPNSMYRLHINFGGKVSIEQIEDENIFTL